MPNQPHGRRPPEKAGRAGHGGTRYVNEIIKKGKLMSAPDFITGNGEVTLKDKFISARLVEEALGKAQDREGLLHDILAAFIARLPQLVSDELIKDWEEKLAFRGEQVQIVNELDRDTKEATMNALTGELIGLETDGSLRLRSEHGNPVTVHFGDVSLRPSADTI